MNDYNGYRSWNAWNCALWLSNNEILDKMMRAYKDNKLSNESIYLRLRDDFVKSRTPDGAKYTQKALKDYIKEYDK